MQRLHLHIWSVEGQELTAIGTDFSKNADVSLDECRRM